MFTNNIVIITLWFTCFSCSIHAENLQYQVAVNTETDTACDTIRALAIIRSLGFGDETHHAAFTVIKALNTNISAGSRIDIPFFYGEHLLFERQNNDTILLTCIYTGDLSQPETLQYRFPGMNAGSGISDVQVSVIGSKHWEACETGQKPCDVLHFKEHTRGTPWYLLIPCGGSETSVSLYSDKQDSTVQSQHIFSGECPPVFDLSYLPAGTYTASMTACGLGSSVSFELYRE